MNLNFLAGIALMLYGIRVLRKGADRLFGSRLRRLLQSATQGRWRALLAGLGLSILIPSSTGIALLSVEAISAGYVSLPQILAVMLGANVGFTITVQFLAFKFYVYHALFFTVGVPLFLFCERRLPRGIGQMLLGLGFLLLSIQLLSAAVVPLRDSDDVRQVMEVLERHPVWLVGFAVILKTLLQSATASIAIAIALCAQGVLSVNGAVAVVVGANIGIALTALLAGFARADTRRMAVGNLLFKLVGAVVSVPFIPWLVGVLRPLSPFGDTQLVANAHTLFNVALALIFLPALGPLAWLLKRLMPGLAATNGVPRLDPAYLQRPALALGQASREILRMADHAQQMLRDAFRAFQTTDDALCAEIQKHDDVVDELNNDIKAYLTRLSEKGLTAEESRREIALLSFTNELESIGDIIDKNLVELAKKKNMLRVEFSKEGWVELAEYFRRVLDNFELAVSLFTGQDRQLAEQLLQNKHQLNEAELELRRRHFHRLHTGLKESFETSAIHLDVLTNLKRINSHLTAVAYPILESRK